MLMNSATALRPSPRFPAAIRLSALALLAGVSSLSLHAQQATAEPGPSSHLVADLSTSRPSLASLSGVDYSSSASDVVLPEGAANADALNLSAAASAGLQPPPRRRYGRPRYNDNSHNPDGSNKYAFVVGAGFTAALGNTYHYLNTNYAFQVGAGRNFNKNFAVLVQFDYDRFGFNGRTLYNQAALYNSPYVYGAGAVSGLDGSSHVWSFSLNPTYTIHSGEGIGAYVVGGVGFYHKTANFTVPGTGTYCDYYGYCYQYAANQTIDKYTSNAPGFNGGLGLTFKPSRFAGERLFVEGRYVFVDNQRKAGFTVNNYTQILPTSTNLFPANSNRTTYTVFKAGIRF